MGAKTTQKDASTHETSPSIKRRRNRKKKTENKTENTVEVEQQQQQQRPYEDEEKKEDKIPAFVVSDAAHSESATESEPYLLGEDDDDDDDNEGEKMNKKNQKSAKTTRPAGKLLSALGRLLNGIRIVALEGSVLAVFAASIFAMGYHDYAEQYLFPHFELMKWTKERSAQALTYYHRICELSDLSATDSVDLLISPDMTTEEKVRHMNTHGASIYPNLLSQETATELRNFILDQNLKGEDMIHVIENKNRWSFGIRVDQHPSVPKALGEVLNNPTLIPALEAIIGPNPAVIEFTGITSAYGAKIQRTHQDVVPKGSGAKYARNFVPSWSLFIPLQNTTAAMGATSLCPGSHMCAAGAGSDYCPEHSFQASGKADNWPMGFGALVNQQTTHRGMAHTDPNGPHRVLFILTFASRPLHNDDNELSKKQIETRMIGLGGSYSLHWTQWGHTLAEFRNPLKYMQQPWRTLRSMGIYKGSSGQWGWDYITQVSGRIANDEMDLSDYLGDGGFKNWPRAWFGTVDEDAKGAEAWRIFLRSMLSKTFRGLQLVHVQLLGAVLAITAIWALLDRRAALLVRSMVRLGLGHAVLWTLALLAMQRVSRLSWSRNIQTKRSFHVPTRMSEVVSLAPNRPATLPQTDDIMMFQQMQSEYLASYADVLDVFHPGNRVWNEVMESNSFGYTEMGADLQEVFRRTLLQQARQEGRRFLAKNANNHWAEIESETADHLCHEGLVRKTNTTLNHVLRHLNFLLTETTVGYWRDSALSRKAIPTYLKSLQDMILPSPKRKRHLFWAHSSTASGTTVSILRPIAFDRILPELPQRTRTPQLHQRQRILPSVAKPAETASKTWFNEEDHIEGSFRGRFVEWYRGFIDVANADSYTWNVLYEDGDYDKKICFHCVRRLVPYAIDEEVEMNTAGSKWAAGRVVKQHARNETFDILLKTGAMHTRVEGHKIRRAAPRTPSNTLQLGSRVDAKYPGAGDRWYAGVIVKENSDGTFAIQYDDGDYAPRIRRKQIRLVGS